MKAVALEHATRGWRVHPVHGIVDGVCTCPRGAQCKSAGKHPVFSDWVKMASADPEVVAAWAWSGHNVGVVPGEDFTILDFDGAPGARLLARMSELLGPVPRTTPIARTGSGGTHVYVAGAAKTCAGLLPGLDIRGIGGQAVMPPSRHYSGGSYSWVNPPTGPVPDVPAWLAVAQGDLPDELRPAEVVTRDDLKALARVRRWTRPLGCVLKGEQWAEHGQRDTVLTQLAGAIAARWPYCDPEQVCDFFRPSIAAAQADGSKATPDGFVKKLAGFCATEKEDLRKRPVIPTTTNIDEMADQAIAALAKRAGALGIYSRGGELVRVRPPEDLPSGVLRGGLPVAFQPLHTANLTAQLSSAIRWVKRTPTEDKNAYPPQPVVNRLDQRGEWPGIPHAERIAEGLVLRPDGTVFPGGGYDSSTGTIGVGTPDTEPLVSTDEAVHALCSAVVDFPFSTPAHKSAWLASVLTAVGQQCFRGPSPMFLIDANVAAAGKSLLAEASILIATGRSPSRATVGYKAEEDRKQITSLAIAGATTILVDNITGLFGTQKLCEVLTLHDSSWSDRVLQKSKTWSGPFKPTWWATANNVRLRPDIARRTCYIRLDSDLEHPELRTGFTHPSLLSWVLEHRGQLYRAAVSMLHHYIAAGRPQIAMPAWGSYEAWGGLIRQTLVWSGLEDPAETREGLAIADEEGDLVRDLLEGLASLELEDFSPSELHHELYGSANTEADIARQAQLRDAFDAGCVQRQRNPTPQSIGRLLTRFRGRVVGAQRLNRLPGKASRWAIEEVK